MITAGDFKKGITVEWAGADSGFLFGSYDYTDRFAPKFSVSQLPSVLLG